MQLATANVVTKEHVLAIGLLAGNDHTHYGKLLEDLENDFMHWDNYPATVQQAYSLLIHWKQDLHNIVKLIGRSNDGMAFTNVGTEDLAQSTGNRDWHQQQQWCYNCNKVGQAALLFWKDLTVYLIQQGLELNPYDNCVPNKQIDGSQCTVLRHVDNNMKISHMSDSVLDEVIADLNK